MGASNYLQDFRAVEAAASLAARRGRVGASARFGRKYRL